MQFKIVFYFLFFCSLYASTNIHNWSADLTYTEGDLVFYEEALYKAKWWTKNEVPSSSGAWSLMEEGVLLWSVIKAYVQGDIIEHNSQQWVAKWWSQGKEPGVTEDWVLSGVSSSSTSSSIASRSASSGSDNLTQSIKGKWTKAITDKSDETLRLEAKTYNQGKISIQGRVQFNLKGK